MAYQLRIMMQKNYAPEELINTYRRFGQFGPAYQVVGISRTLPNGDTLMKIQILESHEITEYAISDILEDPIE